MKANKKNPSSREGFKQKAIDNSFWTTISSIIGRLGGLIFSIIVARLLLPELFGVYMLTLTIIFTILTFVDSGTSSTIARYVSESLGKKGRDSKKEARSRFYFLFKFRMALSIAGALMLFIFAEFISEFIFSEPLLTLPLKIGAFYMVAISLQVSIAPLFLAIQRLNYFAYSEFIDQTLRVIFVSILLIFYLSVETVFIGLSMVTLVVVFFLYGILMKDYSYLFEGKKLQLRKSEKKRMLSFFGWSAIALISLAIFNKIDNLMLGIFLPSEFVGYYAVIFSIVNSVFALLSFTGAFLPAFVSLHKKRFEKAFNQVARYTILIALPASVGLAFLIVPVIKIIYGFEYVPQDYELAISISSILLSFLVFESLLNGLYTVALQAKEKPKIIAKIILFTTTLNIALNYVFITQAIKFDVSYGLVGAALATFVSRYVNLILVVSITRKNLKIREGNHKVFFKSMFSSAIMLSVLFILSSLIGKTLITAPIIVLAGIFIYFFSMIFLKEVGWKDYELLVSFPIINKIRNRLNL